MQNSIAIRKTQIPLRLSHGTEDTYISLSISQTLYDDLILEGTSEDIIELVEFEGENHTSAVALILFDALFWFKILL